MTNIIPRMDTATKNIAFMYHDDDKQWKKDLCLHLTLMRREGLISIIEGSQTMPQLDIIIVLISPSFMGDDKMINAIDYALAHQEGNQRVVPILIRKVSLKGHRIERVQGLPRNGKPIDKWASKDEALGEISEAIRAIVEGRA